ncbi:MAG TPA: 1-acyl-sn-glycerol-3-phosphate acyltransferase, partial [Planctomycetota bacterium]|nr:1-acyl-sn-glycerol-3-phosphate acyltransferase [Planctomycetota bacterium]
RAHLARGHTVVLFPEGTSSRGVEVLPFRPSLLEPAAGGGFPVVPAAVSYRTPAGAPPASRAVCWWGDMTFAGHFVRLLGLPGFDARVAFGSEAPREPDRKVLADNLWQAVRAQFEPVA